MHSGTCTEQDVRNIFLNDWPRCEGSCVYLNDNPDCTCGLIPCTTAASTAAASKLDLAQCEESENIPTGLTNLGATCYLNSILQCLFMQKEFCDGILAIEPELLAHNDTLCELNRLFLEMKFRKKKAANPCLFTKSLLLKDNIQMDVNEFLIKFLDFLERSLLWSSNPNVMTLIKSNFGGTMSLTTTCSECKRNSEKTEPFKCILVPLEGMENLNESLDAYHATTYLTGTEKYDCVSCHKSVDAAQCRRLSSAPNILVFTLLRYAIDAEKNTTKKVNSNFAFPGVLDMSSRLSASANLEYDLCAIVFHIGESVHSGHYYSFIQDQSGTWWKFNDTFVTKLGHHPFGRKKDMFSHSDSYILIYRRRNCSLPAQTLSNMVDFINTRKEEVRSVLSHAPVCSKELGYWIATDWLRQWVDLDITLPLRNTMNQCPHKKLRLSRAGLVKRFSKKSWDVLKDKYGLDSTLTVTDNDICRKCLMQYGGTFVSDDSSHKEVPHSEADYGVVAELNFDDTLLSSTYTTQAAKEMNQRYLRRAYAPPKSTSLNLSSQAAKEMNQRYLRRACASSKSTRLSLNSQSKVGYVYDDKMCLHIPPTQDEPEKPERLTAIWEAMVAANIPRRCTPILSHVASNSELGNLHTEKFINEISNWRTMRQEDKEKFRLKLSDADVYLSDRSAFAARLAAGSVIRAAKWVADKKTPGQSAIAVVRPPGHHAQEDAAGGFCLFNNVALSASILLREGLVNKILIVDWDIHHGNGTQSLFYEDDRVLYFSVHRVEPEMVEGKLKPFYPGGPEWGYKYTGKGCGVGFNVNVPLDRISGNNIDYVTIWDQLLIPIAADFNPDIVLISGGFDAVDKDLGGFYLTPSVFPILLGKLMPFAGGRIVLALEGGYIPQSLSTCVVKCFECLLGTTLNFRIRGRVAKETIDVIANVLGERKACLVTTQGSAPNVVEYPPMQPIACTPGWAIRRARSSTHKPSRFPDGAGSSSQSPAPTSVESQVPKCGHRKGPLFTCKDKNVSFGFSRASSQRGSLVRDSKSTGSQANKGAARASASWSSRSGHKFPAKHVLRCLQLSVPDDGAWSVGVDAAIYLSAVLEYVAREVFEAANDQRREMGGRRLIPRHLQLGIRLDDELDVLFDGVIPGGGVVPPDIPRNPSKLRRCIRRGCLEDL